MFDELIEHLDFVESFVRELSPAGSFGFALACLERQWPVYELASVGKPWNSMVIRAALDLAWDHVIDGIALPSDLVQQCQSACPADDFPSDATVVAAHLISHSAIDLLTAVQDGEANYAHFPAARNIDLLEMLCDEFNDGKSKEQIKLLVYREVEKQKHDLETMRVSSSPDQVRSLRESSMTANLFDGHWFPC